MKAEYMNEMFVYALTEDDSELVSSFSLLRSILDEKILKSPWPSSFKLNDAILIENVNSTHKKKKTKDKVFPIVFQPAKHVVWEINLSESWTPMVKKEKKVPITDVKQVLPMQEKAASSSSLQIHVSSSSDSTSKSLVTIPAASTSENPKEPEHITTNIEVDFTLWPQDYCLQGVVSFGKAIRLFSNFSIQKNELTFLISKQNLTNLGDQNSIPELTVRNSKKITLKKERISQAWMIHEEGAFGFSYDGGVSGIVSSLFFDSSFSFIVFNAPIQKPVVTLFQNVLQTTSFDKNLIKQGVLTPQQLKEFMQSQKLSIHTTNVELATSQRNDKSTRLNLKNISSSNVTNHINTSDKVDNNSNTTISSSVIIDPLHITHDSASFHSPKKKAANAKEATYNKGKRISNNSTILNEHDFDVVEDQLSQTSACYDEYDQSAPTEPNVKKRKLENEDATNALSQLPEVDNEKVQILKRLHQYQILSNEEYLQKVILIDAVERYKNGDSALMKDIIEKKKDFLADFSSFPQFICPLTRTLAKDPVLGDDGRIYDKEALIDLLTKNCTQPSTERANDHRVTKFSIIQSATKEVYQILDSKLQVIFEFLQHVISEMSIFDMALLPLLTIFIRMDYHQKYTLKAHYLKFKIIEANISLFRSNEQNATDFSLKALQDCMGKIITLETEKSNMIPLLIFALKEKFPKDVFDCFSLSLYIACEFQPELMYRQLVQAKSEFLYNNILSAVYAVAQLRSSRFYLN